MVNSVSQDPISFKFELYLIPEYRTTPSFIVSNCFVKSISVLFLTINALIYSEKLFDIESSNMKLQNACTISSFSSCVNVQSFCVDI